MSEYHPESDTYRLDNKDAWIEDLQNKIQQLEQALDLAIRWIDGQIEMSEQQIVSKLHDAKQARKL